MEALRGFGALFLGYCCMLGTGFRLQRYAFLDHLRSRSFYRRLVPEFRPPLDSQYQSWKEISQERGAALLSDIGHVSFEEFIQVFTLQLAQVESVLRTKAAKHVGLRCHVSFYRAGSGTSADQDHKSFGWMNDLLQAYLAWPSNNVSELGNCLRSSSTPRSPTGPQLYAQACMNSVQQRWDPSQDIALIIEDVSYSGTELVATIGDIASCNPPPHGIIPIVPFFSSKAKIAWHYNPKVRRLPSELMFGGSPLDLGAQTFDCNGGLEGVSNCFAYFDHKMADDTSLGPVNILAARGAILDDYTGLSLRENMSNKDLYLANARKVVRAIPYVEGCSEIHRCAAFVIRHFDRLQNPDKGLWCAKKLSCPFPVYKRSELNVQWQEDCQCDEILARYPPVFCDDPGELVGGTSQRLGMGPRIWHVGDWVRWDCLDGIFLEAECLETGLFSRTPPSCEPIPDINASTRESPAAVGGEVATSSAPKNGSHHEGSKARRPSHHEGSKITKAAKPGTKAAKPAKLTKSKGLSNKQKTTSSSAP